MLEGKIKRIVNNEILGWCKHPAHDRAVALGVYINGKLEREILSNEPRKSLGNKGFDSTNYGFRIPLSENWPDIFTLKLTELESKAAFQGNMTLISKPALRSLVYFVHIPKTAGTSFRLMLNESFSENEIFPNLNDIRLNDGLYPNIENIYTLSKERLLALKLINGHYPLSMVDHWKLPLKAVTFFREPTARVISHINHLKKNDKNCIALSKEEIYEKHRSTLINLQLRSLKCSAYPNAGGLNYDAKRFNEKKLISALAMYDAFGVVEHFAESIHWIAQVLNIEIGTPKHKNKSESKNDISEALRKRIKSDSTLEIEAYELIKSEFYRRSSTKFEQ